MQKSPNRTLIIAILVAAVCAQVFAEAPPNAADASPSRIIVLDLDTLAAKHMSLHGYDRETTPNIDAWAKDAYVFDYAFSQGPNTPPSQGAMFTGLYPTVHGFVGPEDRLPDEATTLAEVLRDEGFLTAAFVDGGFMGREFGMDQGFEHFVQRPAEGVAELGPLAKEWLRENADAEKFFLLIHTYDVHTPYEPPEAFHMFFEGLQPPTPGFETSAEYLEAVRASVWTENPITLSPRDLEWAKAAYDNEIRYLDDWIGGFFELLAELGLDENTIVVVVSDHGEEFQQHGSVLHEKIYATVTHVPMIFRIPGREAKPRRIPEVVETMDLMPTLLDLVDAPIPPKVQAESLVPLIDGVDRPPWTAVSESPYFGIRRAIAHGDYRLLWTEQGGATELYDFRRDPFEQEDLSAGMPDLQGRLLRALQNWKKMVESAEGLSAEESPVLSEETLQQLRELGYIQ